MTASEDLLGARPELSPRHRGAPHWRMIALANRLGSAVAPSTDLGGVAVLVVDHSGVVIGRSGRREVVDAATVAGLRVGAELTTAWSIAAVPLSEPVTGAPVGHLCAAEPDSQVSPMVVAWLRIAAAVVEAEWRVTD